MGTSTARSARSPAPARPWRLQRWPTDATIGHLVVHDHHVAPTAEHVEAATTASRRRGDRALRTSALFPTAADVFTAAGFVPIDRLALLRIDLPLARRPRATADGVSLTPLRPWTRRAAAAVDRNAFGQLWGNSAASLRDTLHATPAHRGRLARVDRRVVAVAISGAAGSAGYIQRLAVDPEHQRRGLATLLVLDGLAWMTAGGATSALVNTGIANEAALALYLALGFELLDDELIIAERTWS